jgi:hypothetical protein
MRKKAAKHRPILIQPENQSIRHIPLTQGQICVVDTKWYEFLTQWNWYANWSPHTKTFYAVREKRINGKYGKTRLHAVVLPPVDGLIPDHISGDTLDCREANLRLVTRQQNCWNRTTKTPNGVRGITKCSKTGKYRVAVLKKYYGSFVLLEDAIIVRDTAFKLTYGEFARVTSQCTGSLPKIRPYVHQKQLQPE